MSVETRELSRVEYVEQAMRNGQHYIDKGTDAHGKVIGYPRAYMNAVRRDAGRRYDKGIRSVIKVVKKESK